VVIGPVYVEIYEKMLNTFPNWLRHFMPTVGAVRVLDMILLLPLSTSYWPQF
jgi:hypothetical protein